MFGKKEASEGLKREHYSDKIVKYRLHRLYQGSLVFVVIVAVAAALWISQKNRVYTEYVVTESNARDVAANAKTIVLGYLIPMRHASSQILSTFLLPWAWP